MPVQLVLLSENHIVDKMPFNLFWVGFLAISFPNAKFIHCKRDARATCWSNYETTFSEGNEYSFKLDEIVRHYNNCEDVMLFGNLNFEIGYSLWITKRLLKTQKLLRVIFLIFCKSRGSKNIWM